MSFQAMTWAVEQDLRTAEKMVLVMLANRCNHDTGRCDPSHKRLAKECGMSLSTLKRSIDKLAAAGYLKVEGREQDGVNLPNQYHLNIWVSSQRTHPAQKEPKVRSNLRGGVGSNPADGSGHSELQNNTYNQEVEPGSEPLPVPDESGTAAPTDSVSGVLADSKQEKSKDKQKTPFQIACRETWEAYSEAYHRRYGAAPLGNQVIYSQVQSFVKRIGQEVAPAVASFYVGINDGFYVRNTHAFGLMLKSAEGIHTQWVTGQTMTGTRAKQIDQSQANYGAAEEAKAILRAKRAGERGDHAQ